MSKHVLQVLDYVLDTRVIRNQADKHNNPLSSRHHTRISVTKQIQKKVSAVSSVTPAQAHGAPQAVSIFIPW